MPLRQYVNIIIVKGNILVENLAVVCSGRAVILPMIVVNVVRMNSMQDMFVLLKIRRKRNER